MDTIITAVIAGYLVAAMWLGAKVIRKDKDE